MRKHRPFGLNRTYCGVDRRPLAPIPIIKELFRYSEEMDHGPTVNAEDVEDPFKLVAAIGKLITKV